VIAIVPITRLTRTKREEGVNQLAMKLAGSAIAESLSELQHFLCCLIIFSHKKKFNENISKILNTDISELLYG